MTRVRGWRIALVAVVALIATPLTILASHSQCAAQHHGCAQTAAADDCCCGHVASSASVQGTAGDRVVVSSPDAEPSPALAADWRADRNSHLTVYASQRSLVVIDRLTRFKVLLI